jgi:hypothetical protein
MIKLTLGSRELARSVANILMEMSLGLVHKYKECRSNTYNFGTGTLASASLHVFLTSANPSIGAACNPKR